MAGELTGIGIVIDGRDVAGLQPSQAVPHGAHYALAAVATLVGIARIVIFQP